MNKELILNNLNTLHDAVVAQPEDLFNLETYKQEGSCGTLFCTAGLAACMPVFRNQGLSLKDMGDKWWQVMVGDEYLYDADETNLLFGPDAFVNCFEERYEGSWDNDILSESRIVSDKELAVVRLVRQIILTEQL